MIPAEFDLTIGQSGPIGHVVGHNRASGRTAFRVSDSWMSPTRTPAVAAGLALCSDATITPATP
jgi:hypothetical protein